MGKGAGALRKGRKVFAVQVRNVLLIEHPTQKNGTSPQLQHATISKRLELKDRDWGLFLYLFKLFSDHMNFFKFG
jgi:hypothetical protein